MKGIIKRILKHLSPTINVFVTNVSSGVIQTHAQVIPSFETLEEALLYHLENENYEECAIIRDAIKDRDGGMGRDI